MCSSDLAAEAGLPDLRFTSWVGLLAPAGTPPSVVERFSLAMNASLRDPRLQARLQDMGMHPTGGGPEQMLKQIRDDLALHRRIVAQARLRFE